MSYLYEQSVTWPHCLAWFYQMLFRTWMEVNAKSSRGEPRGLAKVLCMDCARSASPWVSAACYAFPSASHSSCGHPVVKAAERSLLLGRSSVQTSGFQCLVGICIQSITEVRNGGNKHLVRDLLLTWPALSSEYSGGSGTRAGHCGVQRSCPHLTWWGTYCLIPVSQLEETHQSKGHTLLEGTWFVGSGHGFGAPPQPRADV